MQRHLLELVRLDFTGAQLINFALSSARLETVCCDKAMFVGSGTLFDRATFTGFDVFSRREFHRRRLVPRGDFHQWRVRRNNERRRSLILQKQAPALEAPYPSHQGGVRRTMVFRTPAMRSADVSSASGGVTTLSRSPTSQASAVLRRR